MNLDRNTILLLAISIFGFSAYNFYLQSQYPDYFAGKTVEEITPSEDAPKQTSDLATSEQNSTDKSNDDIVVKDRLSPEQLTFKTDTRTIVFDQDYGAITSIKLNSYQKDSKTDEAVELLDSPLYLQGTLDIAKHSASPDIISSKRDANSITFTRQQGDFLIEQKITVPNEGYLLPIEVSFTNIGNASSELTSALFMQESMSVGESDMSFLNPASFVALQKSLVYGLDGSRNEETLRDYCDDDENEPAFSLRNEKLDYIGFNKHYFLGVIWPSDAKMNFQMELARSTKEQSGLCPINLISYQNMGLVQAGQTVTLSFGGYFGPKDLEILEASASNLKTSVKFGWFSAIAHPLLAIVKWLHALFSNYGLAIILVTIALKILFYPLTKAAAVSMRKMQKLQPEMTKLREKFKDDPQRQQRELMQFMAKHKVNPAKGCLPILPQIPVFIAFYNVLSQAIELRHAEFFGWIQDLSAADPYYISPILLGLGMLLQQKLTPTPSIDKNQQRIMMIMPVVFTAMMISLPAGMVLYMITNTTVSIIQQQWLNKKLTKQYG